MLVASASEGAPIQSNLFKEYFKFLRLAKFEIYQEMNREIASFFQLMFNIDVDHGDLDNIDFSTFEEVLGIIDLAIKRGEGFIDFDLESMATNGNRLRQIRVYLILLMAKVLKEKLNVSNIHHNKLVENLKNKGLYNKVDFISTNYDILIDNALSKDDSADVNYGVYYTNFYREKNWSYPKKSARKLFKIHGSLNWLYCSCCNTLTYTPYEKGIVRLVDDFSSCSCPTCESVILPIIVPPTYFKDMSNIFLNEIWAKDEQTLRKSNHIIFCGYSFPDADVHIKYLIKRVQTNRKFDLKFSIINNHTGKEPTLIEEEKKRYNRILGTNVNYTDLSFEQFAENPEVVLNGI